MRNMFKQAVTLAAFGVCTIAGLAVAKADVIRVALVVAENQADYENNVALVPTFANLLKKGPVKATYSGTDPAKHTIVTTSVWASEADIKTVTDTSEWKASAGKLKYKAYTAEVFQVAP
ncbi:MAG: hypothetical protein ACJ8AI_02635 [Rhodopila sp.]